MRSIHIAVVAGVLLAVPQLLTLSMAQSNGDEKWTVEALPFVTEFANKNCPKYETSGVSRSVAISADVNASFSNLLKKVADVSGSGKSEASAEDYTNVRHADLAAALSTAAKCHADLAELVFKYVRSPSSAPQTDSIHILTAAMAMRGNDGPKGYDPSQHYVYGTARITYTGRGPYVTRLFTSCLTDNSQFSDRSQCTNNSGNPAGFRSPGVPDSLEVGSRDYAFEVYLPNPWPRDKAAQVMVCIFDPSFQNRYFLMAPEQRRQQTSPVCDVATVKFHD
jgi:hypothetical protein